LIVSGGLRVCFDKAAALRTVEILECEGTKAGKLTEFQRAGPTPVTGLPTVPRSDDDVAVAEEFIAEGFDSVVVLPLRRDNVDGSLACAEAQEQLSELPTSTLLFRRPLTEVAVRRMGSTSGGPELSTDQCPETQGFIDQCLITSFCRTEGVDH